jgi:hypothetical protein
MLWWFLQCRAAHLRAKTHLGPRIRLSLQADHRLQAKTAELSTSRHHISQIDPTTKFMSVSIKAARKQKLITPLIGPVANTETAKSKLLKRRTRKEEQSHSLVIDKSFSVPGLLPMAVVLESCFTD